MKITRIQGIPLKICCEPIADALSYCTTRQALLVRVSTDTELYGIGEAFTYGAPIAGMKELVEEHLGVSLLGKEFEGRPEEIQRIWEQLYWRTIAHGRRGMVLGALSGIDIALWDLAGKCQGKSIAKLLGQRQEWIPAYASGGFYGPGKGLDGLKAELEGYRQQGYQDLKIKIGRVQGSYPFGYANHQELGVTWEEDLHRVEAAREIAADGRLLVDANAAFPVAMGMQRCLELEQIGVNILEEPLQFEQTLALQEMCNGLTRMKIMGYETEQGPLNFQRLIDDGVCDIIQPDVGWCGGITAGLQIAVLSRAANLSVSLHSFGTGIHFAASLQLAGAIENLAPLEDERNPNSLKSGMLRQPFETDAKMQYLVPEGDGLGVEVDWEGLDALSWQA